MPIDYRDLLCRYIRHIVDVEGSAFLTDDHRNTSKQSFSDDEWVELQRLAEHGFSDAKQYLSEQEWAELDRLASRRYEIGQIIEVGGRKLRITRVEGTLIHTEPLP